MQRPRRSTRGLIALDRTTALLTEAGSPICAHLREQHPDLPEKLLPFVDYKKRSEDHWYYALVSVPIDLLSITRFVPRPGS